MIYLTVEESSAIRTLNLERFAVIVRHGLYSGDHLSLSFTFPLVFIQALFAQANILWGNFRKFVVVEIA